jgi:predicted nucleotidyltransferase
VLERENCIAAILFVSFVKNENLHDIDLCVAHSGGQEPPSREDRLAEILAREVDFSFDIIPMTIKNFPLCAAVIREGVPILNKAPELLDNFYFHTWIDEQDFRPILERFYEERFGFKS